MLSFLCRVESCRLLNYEVLNRIALLKNRQTLVSGYIHTTATRSTLWERHKKSGYKTELPLPSKKQLILDGLKELKQEIALWKEEVKEKLATDPIVIYRPGEIDVAFSFKDDKDISKWVTTTDQDHNEGFSEAALEISPAGHGLFHGNVDARVPKDGKIKKSGYANVRTKRVRKSFKRETTYNWTAYNTLVMRVRGDGRSYLLNLHCEGYFDLLWNDVYHYILFTRGGPHWQVAKIPFSKFFFSSKGRVQDRQEPIKLDRVTHFGISVGARGGHDGPFSLEIDYIGLEFDPMHNEEFAYEMYQMPKYLVGT